VAGRHRAKRGFTKSPWGKGESGIVDGLKLTFLRFDMSGHTESDQAMVVGAALRCRDSSHSWRLAWIDRRIPWHGHSFAGVHRGREFLQ